MKILVISDQESKALWDYYTPDKFEGIDFIIACGDLKASYLEFLVTMTNLPIYYVTGNHDSKFVDDPPGGCICIDDKVVVHKGIRIAGLGGSMKYKPGPYMYEEKEMRARIRRLKTSVIKKGGIDILVTHAAPRGYGDMEDIAHKGFECFNDLLERCKPLYMLHGHVHQSYRGGNFKRELKHKSGTEIINCYERYILEYDENEHSPLTKKELTKNLLTVFTSNNRKNGKNSDETEKKTERA